MFVFFRKIFRALFSGNTQFEICPFALLPTISFVSFYNFLLLLDLASKSGRVSKCSIKTLEVETFTHKICNDHLKKHFYEDYLDGCSNSGSTSFS